MLVLLPLLLAAGAVTATALPQLAPPRLFNTTNETAAFTPAEFGPNVYPPIFPGPYKGLQWNMYYFDYREYTFAEYYNFGALPPMFYEGGGFFHATNGSSGSLTNNFTNSTTDHFQMFSFYAGCNGRADIEPPPGGNQGQDLPYPANCTITAKGYNSKLNPLGTPLATTTFKYRPVLIYGRSLFNDNGTAGMQQFTFPRSFQFLDKVVFTATLDNIPPGVYYNATKGLDMLITDVQYSISQLAVSL